MKRTVLITILVALFLSCFASCGTFSLNSSFYKDAVSNLKENTELEIVIKQEITTIISGGSSTTTSTAKIKAIHLDDKPIFQTTGSIFAIGANVPYNMYFENNTCYMQVYDTKTKVEGDFSSALQKCVGIQMDTIDLKTLLNLSDEDLKKTTLQTIEGVNVLSATLDWEEKELSDVLVSYFIDSDRQLIGMMIEAKRNTTYADKETNITFQWELSFTKPEKEIEIVAPTDLDSYVLQEDKS